MLVGSALLATAQPTNAPEPHPLAQNVWFLSGGLLPNRQPDGNTVVFQGPEGLVVFDTGRHPWHSQAILSFARAQKLPITAIVNSHWHLDHVSGNPALKVAYPRVRVYASNAIDEALTGFLQNSMASSAEYLKTTDLPPETVEDLRLDMSTIAKGSALKPDIVLHSSGVHNLAGMPSCRYAVATAFGGQWSNSR
jgi:glyoxylase-like metal-dependent hydrolase (beta-lactamase superfamily II)